ncbi:MAG: acyl-CoA dehydrogenase family protein [Myxococcales bacterium]|nr:acyl-CoA dehydrogenase family protein [Myxococcales bacterium]
MQLILDEDQTMLAQTAGAFFNEHSPISRFRALRDGDDSRRYSLELYRQMAELGWTAIPFSEADGGLGLGLASMIVVTEAAGRTLAPEPLLESVMMAGQALSLAGNAAQKERWLTPLIAGESVLALAHSEPASRYDLSRIELQASADGDGYRLQGRKLHVLGGAQADAFVVAARSAGQAGEREGISLFIVPADAAGVKVQAQGRVDSRNAAILELESVRVDGDALLGELGAGHGVLETAIDRATVALCGEMLGGMNAAFEMTLDYLKERKQFDTVIGTFQALKHRAARMFIELELARSVAMAAARALDAENGHADPQARSLVSLAKAKLSEAYCLIANEAVQMHGGIGMTDEHDIGFYMKRARASEMTFGDAAFHRDRFASLGGY